MRCSLVEDSETSAGAPVVEATGATAYGDGSTRQDFTDAGRKLVARVPGRPNSKHLSPRMTSSSSWPLAPTPVCPDRLPAIGSPWQPIPISPVAPASRKASGLLAAVCKACPLRTQCTSARAGVGRTVRLHPQETLLQEARRLQDSPAYDEYRQLRVVAEHRLARLVQLGIRQARYFGRAKTRFQLYLAATVANITLLAQKFGRSNDFDPEIPAFCNVADANANIRANLRGNLPVGHSQPDVGMAQRGARIKTGFPAEFLVGRGTDGSSVGFQGVRHHHDPRANRWASHGVDEGEHGGVVAALIFRPLATVAGVHPDLEPGLPPVVSTSTASVKVSRTRNRSPE